MYRYQVVLKDDPTCFGEPCSYNQARAEANRLNQLHRDQRVAALIAEREKALVEALELALEYWSHKLQRYKNRSPVWVQKARAALEKAGVR